MEGTMPVIMMLLYGAFFLLSVVIVIYLIIKRIKTRGKEGFEERDN